MTDIQAPHTEVPSGPALAVAERWADFTKAFAIYPEANQRVQEALEAFQEALADAEAGSEGDVEVLFHHEALRAGGEEAELRAGSNLRWLHDRVHKAALAGVGFARDVPADSVLELTRQLLAHFTRKTLDESFEDLWPTPYEGVRLVERRFEGLFGEEGVTGGARTRSWGGSGPGEVGAEGGEELVALLAGEERIQRRLLRLKNHLAEEVAADEDRERVDVLGRLVHLLPKDAIQEYDAFVGLTAEVLDRLEERIKAGADAKVEGLNQLLFAASRGLLAREKETDDSLAARLAKEHTESECDAAADAPVARGHAGDEDIQDDREALLEELEAFPPPAPERLIATDVESTPEALDVLLHNLIRTESRGIQARIHELLAGILRKPGPAEVAVLREYMTTYWRRSDEGASEVEFERILDFLLDMRQAPLLRMEGFLRAETTAKTFPRYFGLYLDSLDPEDPDHVAELRWVMEAVGSDALSRERTHLLQRERLVEGDRISRLLTADDPSLLPLARFALELGGTDQKAEAALYLKRLKLEAREACLLQRSVDPSKLPLPYLVDVASPFEDGSYPPDLARDVASILCRQVEALADDSDPKAEIQRVSTIDALARFRTTESKRLMMRLLKSKRMLVIASEPPAVREAAKHVLKIYGIL